MSSVDQRLNSLQAQIHALATTIAALQHQVAILAKKEGQREAPPPMAD